MEAYQILKDKEIISSVYKFSEELPFADFVFFISSKTETALNTLPSWMC